MSYSSERPVIVWCDATGERYAVGPDRDGLGLVEVSYVPQGDTAVSHSVVMPREVWEHIRRYDPEDSQ